MKMHRHRFGYIFEPSKTADNRARRDGAVTGFIIKTHIPGDDGGGIIWIVFQRDSVTSIRHTLDTFHKFPHLVRLLRIAKAETVGNSMGRSTHSRHIPHGFHYGIHTAPVWIDESIPRIVIRGQSNSHIPDFFRVIFRIEGRHNTRIGQSSFGMNPPLDLLVVLFKHGLTTGHIFMGEYIQ